MDAVVERVLGFLLAMPRTSKKKVFSQTGRARMGLNRGAVTLTDGFHTVRLDPETLRTLSSTTGTRRGTYPIPLRPMPLSDAFRSVSLVENGVAVSHGGLEVTRVACDAREVGLHEGAMYVLDRCGAVTRYGFIK